MLLDQYDQEGLLFNKNFKEAAKTPGYTSYRGELVLLGGEVADAKGHKTPPVAVMRSAVMLEKEGKLQFVAGFLDELDLLNAFIERYKKDFAADMRALFYVVNLSKPMQVEFEGLNFILIPLVEGVTWNELIDELALEKSDFKGQSAGEKLVTLWDNYKDYKAKYEDVAFTDAFGFTAAVKKFARGPV